MEGNPDARERGFPADLLALGVAGVHGGTRLVAPKRLGDLVDEIVRLLGGRGPLRADRQRLDPFDVLVDAVGARRVRTPGRS